MNTSTQKKGKILQIPLRQGGVHETKKRQDLYLLNWKSSYDVMLFIYQSYEQQFRGILICAICRPRDMQEYYMLFEIFAKDVGLYFLSVFYITWANFQYTNVYLLCVLHTYHCVPFTGECHGTAAYKAQTMSIYDVIGHRSILFLPWVWTRSISRTSY